MPGLRELDLSRRAERAMFAAGRRSVLRSATFVVLFVSCQSTPPTPAVSSDHITAPATLLPPPSTAPFPGIRWTVNGEPATSGSITLRDGGEHCGWNSATFLTIGWPLGVVPKTSAQAREYVRDPKHLFDDEILAPFLPSTTLPSGAFDTGYRYGSDELWVDTATVDQVVYVVRDSIVEQWPRGRELFACA